MHRRTLTLLIALGGVVRVAASQSPVVRA